MHLVVAENHGNAISSWRSHHPTDFVYNLSMQVSILDASQFLDLQLRAYVSIPDASQISDSHWLAAHFLFAAKLLVKVCSMLNPKPSKNRFPYLL